MELETALGIHPGVTAIIGAGGKSTLLLALGRALAQRGRVLLGTTTHIYPPEGVHLVQDADAEAVRRAFLKERLLCVGTQEKTGKLTAPGLADGALAKLADYVLLEADGAHGRPAKAHADYEPVVPREAEQVILVFGLTALGRPIAEAVHRPEIFAARMGVRETEMLREEMAAEFLNREAPHSRVLLNQADAPGCEASGRRMAKLLEGPVCLGAIWKGWMECLC